MHIDLNDALGSDWDDSASEDFKEDKPEKGGEKGGKVRACEDADERGPASTSQRLEGRSSGDAAQANIAQGSPLQQEDLSQPAASPPAAEGSSRKKPCQPSITGKEAAFQVRLWSLPSCTCVYLFKWGWGSGAVTVRRQGREFARGYQYATAQQ